MFLLRLIRDGGPVMWIILFCSIVSLFVFLMKVFQFHREEINVRELLRGLFNVLKREGLVEAITLCDHTPGPAAKLLGAAIIAYQRGDEDIRAAVDEAALEEIPKLERHLNILATLGFVLPLIGLFGTVVGMIKAFEAVRVSLSSTAIAGAVTMALISTAAALAVAIPCYIGYNYLLSRVNTITLEMEKAALEITAFFERRRKKNPENK